MKLIDQMKSMFINNEEVSSFKSSQIFHNFVYMNDSMLSKNFNGNFIWLLSFKEDNLPEFIQIAEVLPKFKFYSFTKENIVIAPLTSDDCVNVCETIRYANNPFIHLLLEDIQINIPSSYAFETLYTVEGEIKLNFDRESLKGSLDDDFKEIEINKRSYVRNMICESVKVLACDNIRDISSSIVSTFPKMAPYITDYDMFDIGRIVIEDLINNKKVTYTYRELFMQFLDFDNQSNQVLKDLYYLLQNDEIMGGYLTDMRQKITPPVVEVNPQEEVDDILSEEMVDYNLPDTSKINQDHFIQDKVEKETNQNE